MFNLMFGWAAFVGISVFVLYLRDPYAVGKHRSHFEKAARKTEDTLRSLCNSMRSRGLCPSNF